MNQVKIVKAVMLIALLIIGTIIFLYSFRIQYKLIGIIICLIAVGVHAINGKNKLDSLRDKLGATLTIVCILVALASFFKIMQEEGPKPITPARHLPEPALIQQGAK